MEISLSVGEKKNQVIVLWRAKLNNISVLAAFNFMSAAHAQLQLLKADVLKKISMMLLKGNATLEGFVL